MILVPKSLQTNDPLITFHPNLSLLEQVPTSAPGRCWKGSGVMSLLDAAALCSAGTRVTTSPPQDSSWPRLSQGAPPGSAPPPPPPTARGSGGTVQWARLHEHTALFTLDRGVRCLAVARCVFMLRFLCSRAAGWSASPLVGNCAFPLEILFMRRKQFGYKSVAESRSGWLNQVTIVFIGAADSKNKSLPFS